MDPESEKMFAVLVDIADFAIDILTIRETITAPETKTECNATLSRLDLIAERLTRVSIPAHQPLVPPTPCVGHERLTSSA